MARYEDTATPFAEQQFAGVRERKQKEAEKQDKFAKKLLMFKTVAEGANAVINQRADQLEANQTAKKTAYQKTVQNAEDLLKQETMLRSANMTAENYYTNIYYNQLVQDAETTYENYNLGATTNKAGTTAHNFLRAEASRLGKEKATLFENAVTQAKDVGTLEDFDKRWDSLQDIQSPRTIFGAVTSAAKNVFEKETPETVAYKEGIATDALFNQPIVKEYKEFGDSLKIYSKAGFDVGSIINDLGSNFDMVVKQGDPNVTSVSETYIDANGVKRNKTKLVVYSKDANENINIIQETVSDAIVPAEAIETTSIEKALDSVPDRYKDVAAEYFTGSYSTQEDLMSFFKWQASDKAFRKSPIKDVKDGIDLVKAAQADILSSLGFLTQEQIDEHGLTGYEVGEQMYNVDLDKNNLVTPRPEFGKVIRAEGWDFVSLVDSYFENFDITGLEMFGTPEEGRTISSSTVYRQEVKRQFNKQAQKTELLKTFELIVPDTSKTILTDSKNIISGLVENAEKDGKSGLITLDTIKDLSKLGIGLDGMGTITVDLDDKLIYYKKDEEAKKDLTADTTGTNTGNVVPSGLDDFTIQYQDKKLLDFGKVNTILADLDVSDLSKDELVYLSTLSIYDIKSRIGLEDISKGGLLKSGKDLFFVERMNEKLAMFKNLDIVQEEIKDRFRGELPYSILGKGSGTLPEEFYAQLKELFITNLAMV